MQNFGGFNPDTGEAGDDAPPLRYPLREEVWKRRVIGLYYPFHFVVYRICCLLRVIANRIPLRWF
jgi:hypothetical protein